MKLPIVVLLAIPGASAQLSKRPLRGQKDLAEDKAAPNARRVLQESMSMMVQGGTSEYIWDGKRPAPEKAEESWGGSKAGKSTGTSKSGKAGKSSSKDWSSAAPTVPVDVCTPECPESFEGLQLAIDGCIDSNLYSICLDACNSKTITKKRNERHIVIDSPDNEISLFCKEGIECLLATEAFPSTNEENGGLLLVKNTLALNITNLIFDGGTVLDDGSVLITAVSKDGGLVHVEDVETVSISCSRFIYGSAPSGNGGCVSIVGSQNVTISSNIMVECGAKNGGGISIEAPEADIFANNTSFTKGSAFEKGGGAYMIGKNIDTQDELYFHSCIASEMGAGIYFEANDIICKRLRCDSCKLFSPGDCGGCLAAQIGNTFSTESFHAMLPVSDANGVTTFCIEDNDGNLLDPIYSDWKTGEGATPFDSFGETWTRIKIANAYWCADIMGANCDISARLKEPDSDDTLTDS